MTEWQTLRDRLGLRLRPISDWPGQRRGERDRSPFSAKLPDTLAMLKRELDALGARELVLEADFREQDFRLDGLPRANASPLSPRIVLSFACRHGRLRLHFDGFQRWEFNLRAVAMHLHHLRIAGLYGVGKDGEQYKGWIALPAATLTDEAAGAFLAQHSGFAAADILAKPDRLRQAYRAAAAKLHPDAGGDHDLFVRLGKALAVVQQRQRGTGR
jgi:hypothetical protein